MNYGCTDKEGCKFDTDKLRYDLVPMDALSSGIDSYTLKIFEFCAFFSIFSYTNV
jgi:hypothetical protein